MAKETPKHDEGKGGKKKRLHLREIRTRLARDGSLVHHHTYADDVDAEHEHPERGPMATSAGPDEAGQHVTEMFGQNDMGGGAAGAQPGQGEGEGEPEQVA